MPRGKWRKIKNSIDFIALSKQTKKSPKNDWKYRFIKLRKTICIAYFVIRTMFRNLNLGSKNIFFKPRPQLTSKNSKWKKVGNSLHFISLSKEYASVSKAKRLLDQKYNEKVWKPENIKEK